MKKIASPRELQAELKAIQAFIHASEKPDRQVIASKLRALADRVAGDRVAAGGMKFRVWTGPTQVKEVAKRLQRAGIDAQVGTEHVFGTMDAEDKYDAMDKINAAAGYKLIQPRDLSNPRQVSFRSATERTASAPSVGQKDKVREDTYKVLKVYPTKDDADGPLPKGLLRLIKKGGGAALVELLPSGDYKVKNDMLVSPDSSRPRYYIRAFGPSGSWDGFPVDLKPAQYKRLQSYH